MVAATPLKFITCLFVLEINQLRCHSGSRNVESMLR